MKKFIRFMLFLLCTQQAVAQHVYQIRADSVRIYNVCDTAELIIENRTRGISGYLYNKGNGRTEFRRIELVSLGDGRIAISGQDTLDLTTLPGLAGIDSIYRTGDNIIYVKKGVQHSINLPYAPAVHTHDDRYYTKTQLQSGGQAQINWGNLSGVPVSFPTNSNLSTVLANGNTATNNISLGAAGNTSSYTFSITRNINGTNHLATYGLYAGNPGASMISSNGVNTRVLRVPSGATTADYSPDNGVTFYNMWHANNHPAGTVVNQNFTGAAVPASIVANSAGHITSVTSRNLTAAEIGAAPNSGSSNYIQNTAGVQASSNFYISGNGIANTSFQLRKNGNAAFDGGSFLLYNAGLNRGVNFQLSGDAIPGLATWVHDGTSWQNRFNIFSTGQFQFPGIFTGTSVELTSAAPHIRIGGTGVSQTLSFDRDGAVYIKANNALGYFNFITGGAVNSDATAALTISANNNATFRGNIVSTGTMNVGSIPAMGSSATTFLTTNNGVVSSRSAAQVRDDIGAVATSGSNNYIQNITAGTQAASFRLSNSGAIIKDGSNALNTSLILLNSATTRGVNFQLNGDPSPGLATWINNGQAWQKRFEVFANGDFQFPNILTGNSTGTTVNGTLSIGNVSAYLAPATSFLVNQDNLVKSRTAAQVLADIGAAPVGGSVNYLNNTTSPQAANGRITGTFGVQRDGSSTFLQSLILYNAAGTRWGGWQLNGDANPGVALWQHNGTSTIKTVEHFANGNTAFTGTVAVNTIPASASTATTFLTSNGGVISSRTAAQVLADIGAVSGSGSGNYIQNQQASAQAANFYISGNARALEYRSLRNGSNSLMGQFTMFNAAQDKGVNFQLNGDANPGLAAWIHNGTTWAKRMELFANGTSSFYGNITVPGGVFSGTTTGALPLVGGASNAYQGGQIALYAGNHPGRPGQIGFYSGLNATGLNPERMTILSNGYVGIGAITPATILDVVENGNAANTWYGRVLTRNATSAKAVFMGNRNGRSSIAAHNSALNAWDTLFVNASPASLGSTALGGGPVIMAGNVGIGTTTPGGHLDIATSSTVELQFSGLSAANIYQAASAQPFYMNSNTGSIFIGANGSGSQHLNVLSNGNVGIGTASPVTPLHAYTNSNIYAAAFGNGSGSNLKIAGTAGTGPVYSLLQTFSSGSTAGGSLILQRDAGNVGVGTFMPNTTMDVRGTFAVGNGGAGALVNTNGRLLANGIAGGASIAAQNYNGTAWGNGILNIAATNINGSGSLTMAGQVQATGYYQSSLRSLKKDIKPFAGSALNVINKASVRTFIFKADSTGHTNVGFIADEVPEEMSTPGRTGVDQASTVGLLVKSVQELSAQKEELEVRVKKLEAAIEKLLEKQDK